MTINLPNDLETRLAAAVHLGRFASIDEAMAEAARLLLRELDRHQPQAHDATNPNQFPLGSIGAMRDDAALLDEIVADAYRRRREETWREVDL